MGGKRGECRVLVGKLKERDHLEDLGIGMRIILKRILIIMEGCRLDSYD
jgi:hypothetical protein